MLSSFIKWFGRSVLPERLRIRLEGSFVNLIRRNRLHHVRYNGDAGIDVTFIEYKYVATPPDSRLVGLVAAAGLILCSEEMIQTLHDNDSESYPSLFDFGNHYLLLTSLAKARKAKKIVEIGTAGGASLWAWLRADCVEMVSTWDIRPLEDSYDWLATADCKKLVTDTLRLESNRWQQFVEDLSDSQVWEQRRLEIADADIIFIDGPHDGIFETAVWSKINSLHNVNEILLVFDDIRLSSMVDFWTGLPVPKLDITFIGHQSGTGVALLEANRK